MYPYARKCIAHEKYQNKSQASTKNSCGKYVGRNSATLVLDEILDICPNSTNETDCKGNEFFCDQSKSCVEKAKICDGIVHCIFGEDEDWDLCKSPFPETATVQCKEIDRGSYNITILATPCNGIRECGEKNDEDCEKDWIAIILSLSTTFVLILVLFAVLFYKVTKEFRAIVPYVAENIDEETANTRSALKGDALAKLKVRLYSLENLSKHQNNFIYILIFNSQNDHDMDTCSKLLQIPGCSDPITNFLERYEKYDYYVLKNIFISFY